MKSTQKNVSIVSQYMSELGKLSQAKQRKKHGKNYGKYQRAKFKKLET